MMLKDGDSIFDGFMHRPFNDKFDGWRNALPDASHYPAVKIAQDVLAMFEEIGKLKRENWELQQEVEMLRPLLSRGPF